MYVVSLFGQSMLEVINIANLERQAISLNRKKNAMERKSYCVVSFLSLGIDTLQGKKLSKVCLLPSREGCTLRERICSHPPPGGRFFPPLGRSFFRRGLMCKKGTKEITIVVSFVKMAKFSKVYPAPSLLAKLKWLEQFSVFAADCQLKVTINCSFVTIRQMLSILYSFEVLYLPFECQAKLSQTTV